MSIREAWIEKLFQGIQTGNTMKPQKKEAGPPIGYASAK
jgi:hypothetical protein